MREGRFRANITEIGYGTIRGGLFGDHRQIATLDLRIDGRLVAQTSPSEDFELDARRPLAPSEKVEVVASLRSGRVAQVLEWGYDGPSLPQQWLGKNSFSYPSLFVLGAAKSGTTSLHVWLDTHPEIFMSRPKEPFFFEAEYQHGAGFYFRKYFSSWNGQRIVGESRHRNLYLPFVPERIYKFNPDARLLAILRNPARRAISHWWHWRSRNMEPLPLRQALEADLARIKAGDSVSRSSDVAAYGRSLGRDYRSPHRTYLDSGYYADQLSRYIQLFGKDRISVILLDDLIAKPTEVMSNIFRFLDVDPKYASDIHYLPLNVSSCEGLKGVDKATESWLIDHYKTHNRELEDLLGRLIPRWFDQHSA